MAVRIRKTGSVIATFPSAQQVDISHLNDSIRVGDGTDLMGPLQNVGGVLCYPVKVMAATGGDASAANQTSGAQKTQIVDDSGTNTVDATAMGGGVFALKVDVVSSVGGAAAPAFVDDAAFTVGTSQGTPAGGTYRSVLDAVDDNDYGVFAMTQRRALHASLRKESDGSELLGQKTMAGSVPVALASDQSALAVTKSGTWDITNAGTFAVQDSQVVADDAPFTVATTKLFMMGANYKSVVDAVDDNDAGNVHMTQRRSLHVSLRKESDASEMIGQKAMAASIPVVFASDQSALSVASHAVTNAGTFAIQDSEKIADNAAFTDTVTKVLPVGLIYDEVAGTALTENDIGTPRMNVNRSSVHCIEDGVTRARYATVTAANALKVDASGVAVPITDNAGSLTVDGTVTAAGGAADDAPTSGNPNLIAFSARLTTLRTIVSTADDAVKGASDGYGRQLVLGGGHPVENIKYQTTNNANTTETTIVTADANNCLDIIALILTNNSDVQSVATIKDSTAGTTRLKFLVPARGGVVFTPCQPIPQLVGKNNNWTITMGTTASSTDVTAIFGLRPT